ncbi:MAG: FecR domain-containing protein [Ignavibacteriales bacterium]|nr:FecR domain-containing protein [Ignavibacteriales bacterium]
MNAKKLTIVIAIMGIALVSLGPNLPQDKKDFPAYVVKVIRDVDKRGGGTTGWTKAVALDRLRSGYELKTDKSSLAVVVFSDQTKLIIREKSIVTIRGEVQGKEVLNRDIYMDRGNVQFNVKKQEKEQFRFSSPISVASIRGTEGMYNSGGTEDFLTISEGLADFTNSISGRTVPVATGETGHADSTGGIRSRRATDDELKRASGSNNNGDEGKKDEGKKEETKTSSGIIVDGSFGFDPTPTAGTASTVKIDLNKTNTDIASVKFYYRAKKTTEFKSLALTLSQKVATGQIPAADVVADGLEYYFEIKLGNNQMVTLPQAGASGPTSINVMAPVTSTGSSGVTITATPVFSPSPIRSFANLGVRLDLSSVSVDIQSVTLNYRRESGAFKPLVLMMSGKVASGQIPGIDVQPASLSYYFTIKLKDNSEVMLPSGGESSALSLSIPPLRRLAPAFSTLKSKNPANVRIDLSPVDANITGVTFYSRKAGDASFKETQMTVSGKNAAAQFQASEIKFPRLEYYFTLRFDDGSTYTVPAEGSTAPVVQSVQAVQRELRIPGQTGALARKVVVLRWNE